LQQGIMNLSIVLLNWNSHAYTRACLNSLFKCAPASWSTRILVVDNGSTDCSLAKLRREFDGNVEFVSNPENLGYAGGNNLGARRALELGADLVLFLNNDTTVDPSFLTALEDTVKQRPHHHLFGAKIFYHRRPHTLWYAGGDYSSWLAKVRQFGMNDADGPPYQCADDTSFITGCCLLIRREVFERIGLFREEYFMYHEDLDFCMRAKRAGLGMLFVPKARLWHHIGAYRDGELSPLYLYYQTRNRYVVFGRERCMLYRLWLGVLQLSLYAGIRSIYFFLSGNRRWPQQIRALWHGCIDGFLHRLGPSPFYQ
jgi:GT2 family glycosyltransferase